MDRFSLEVLERTIELAVESMPPEDHPRVAACVGALLPYVKSPKADEEETVQTALIELVQVSRLNGQFLIAARLTHIVNQLSISRGALDARAS
jgi:hypothetical protein